MNALTRDQFQGTLLGLAIGDALGSRWEGMPADMIYAMGTADEIVAHLDRRTIYYTDDTQMMIGVAQVLIEQSRIESSLLAAKFAENYHPDRGYGQGARRIINAIGSGEDWETLTETLFDGQGSLGNGAAMRVSPVGVFFCPNLEVVQEEATRSALPTHRHELGIDGARILAAATMLAAISAGKAFDRDEFLTQLLTVANTEEFQWQLHHARRLDADASLLAFGNSLEAHRSVMTAVMCFANSPDNYTETISRAIGQGNDVDTLAAMAGTLSGARLGLAAIPQHLLDCLEDDHQGKTFLLDLADRLWEKHVAIQEAGC